MDLRTLEIRLENWARAQRSSGYEPGRASSAEGGFRSGYRELRPAPDPIDHVDALLVNNAWQRCMAVDKGVLMLHYVRRASPMVILRQLGLLHSPPRLHDAHVRAWLRAKRVFLRRHKLSHDDVFDFALYHAQHAIWEKLSKSNDVAKSIGNEYNLRRLQISGLAE
jgi:toxin CptA